MITLLLRKKTAAYLILVISLIHVTTSHHLSASVILYQQEFTNLTGTAVSESTVGWNSYYGSTATNLTSETSNTNISSSAGNPNSNAGYFSVYFGTTNPYYALTTTFSEIDMTNSTITWNMGNASTTFTAQLLVQISGNWYISNQTFSNTSAYANAAAFASASTSGVQQSYTFSTLAANWSSFTLISGSTMAIGSTLSSDLSSSSITGIGLYIANPNSTSGYSRIDEFTISTVPEPSSTCLLGLGLLFGGLICWKHISSKKVFI